MDKFLMNKIIQLSAENAVLKNENEYLKEQMCKKTTDQSSELELRKRLINLKYKEI